MSPRPAQTASRFRILPRKKYAASRADSAISAQEAGLYRFCLRTAAQPWKSAELSRMSAQSNCLNQMPVSPILNRINIVRGDIRQIKACFEAGAFDFVVSNPPYFEQRTGKVSAQKGNARSDISCALSDICFAGAYLLKNGGKFFICFRPERLCEFLDETRARKIEPKVLRPVCHNADSSPFVLLFECVKGAKPGLNVQKCLYLFTKKGKPTAESDRIYGYAGRGK